MSHQFTYLFRVGRGVSLIAMPEARVFLSYARDDAQWSVDLAGALEREKVRTFLRERDISPGMVEFRKLEEAIDAADAAVLVIGAATLTDPRAGDEYAALFQESALRGLRLIPVLHGARSIRLRPLMGTRLWADFRELGRGEYDSKVAALASVIREAPAVLPQPTGVRRPPVEVLDAVRATTARPDQPPPSAAFVVTYARPDASYGERLVNWLTRSGLPAWSIADLEWGSRYIHEIRERLRRALAVIVVMSPDAEESENVEREILEAHRHRREFLAVLLRGEVNFLLASSRCFDARGGALPGEPELRRLHRIWQAYLTGRPVAAPRRTPPRPRVPVVPGPPGTPLRRLRALLREDDFAHADVWTTALVLASAGRTEVGWLDRADAAALPLSRLDGIDRVWAEQTGGVHGFRQQLDIYRLANEYGNDFIELAEAYGWRPGGDSPDRRAATPTYEEFVTAGQAWAGFFPTLRNPQVETYPGWYGRWQSTVIGVHLRLRDWKKEERRC